MVSEWLLQCCWVVANAKWLLGFVFVTVSIATLLVCFFLSVLNGCY